MKLKKSFNNIEELLKKFYDLFGKYYIKFKQILLTT